MQSAVVMQQTMRGMFYMHENKITHRDIKPENFLLGNKEPVEHNVLKIIDFGLSAKFEPGVPLTSKAGTPYYVAPEVLAGSYDEKNDIWSCGVMMFVLLAGYPPFYGDTDKEVVKAVKSGEFQFDETDWYGTSEESKDLIKNMLVMDTNTRYSAAQTLMHPWMKNHVPKDERALEYLSSGGLVESLRRFRNFNQLKKGVLQVIAGQMDDETLHELRHIFFLLDDNGDGQLTPEEVRNGLADAGLRQIPGDLECVLREVDADGSGVIDYTEFIAAALKEEQYTQKDAVWAAFRVFDRDGDSKISKKDLDQVLAEGEDMGIMAMAEILKDVDQDGDGEIDFDEFMDMLKAGPNESEGRGDEKGTEGLMEPQSSLLPPEIIEPVTPARTCFHRQVSGAFSR
jgi:calcium-dependent protein kinase